MLFHGQMILGCILVLALSGRSHAGPPEKKPVPMQKADKEKTANGKAAKDELPPPRTVEPEIVILPFEPPPTHGKRSVWQLYGVTGSGTFVPRVVLAPGGAYYLYNGMDYPWPSMRTTVYMPYAQD